MNLQLKTKSISFSPCATMLNTRSMEDRIKNEGRIITPAILSKQMENQHRPIKEKNMNNDRQECMTALIRTCLFFRKSTDHSRYKCQRRNQTTYFFPNSFGCFRDEPLPRPVLNEAEKQGVTNLLHIIRIFPLCYFLMGFVMSTMV